MTVRGEKIFYTYIMSNNVDQHKQNKITDSYQMKVLKTRLIKSRDEPNLILGNVLIDQWGSRYRTEVGKQLSHRII